MVSMILKMSGMTVLYTLLTVLLYMRLSDKPMTTGRKIAVGIIYGICSVLSTHFGVDYNHMMVNVRDIGPLAAGLFFTIEGVDESKLLERRAAQGEMSMRYTPEIETAMAAGEYPIPRKRLGLYKSCDGTWRCNITRIPDVDGSTTEGQTAIMLTGRKQIMAILKFLRKYVRGCENIRLVETATMPGIRETRRIHGDFVLREQSLIDGEVFPDTILVCSNSRDTHIGLGGIYIPSTTSYTLPYRMLLPHGIDNLLAAGRNVSCDRPVLSAIRVMPPCFGLGEAAGNAAAIAIEQNCACADIDVKLLQQRLASENACLEK